MDDRQKLLADLETSQNFMVKLWRLNHELQEQKEDVDSDTYKWTTPYIDIWLLNDFPGNSKIGTINVKTGEFQYKDLLNKYIKNHRE